MKTFLYNAKGRLRNGWWILFFAGLLALFGFGQVKLMWLIHRLGIPGGSWTLAIGLLPILGATWVVLKVRKERFASAGFNMNTRWARELGLGMAIGIGQIVLAALIVWALGGVRFEANPARSFTALIAGMLLFFVVAVKEETLFRGFLFQRLRDGIGLWPTLILLGALFAFAHWSNPGMQGATKFWATMDIGIGAVAYGLAYQRTGSLALPIGIHLGWNWAQGHVLGFGVSGVTTGQGWILPVFQGKAEWLTGGSFGLEASVFAVVMDVVLLVFLLTWQGNAPQIGSPIRK